MLVSKSNNALVVSIQVHVSFANSIPSMHDEKSMKKQTKKPCEKSTGGNYNHILKFEIIRESTQVIHVFAILVIFNDVLDTNLYRGLPAIS